MTTPSRTRPLLAATALVSAMAVYFVLVELHRPDVVGANDIYAYFLPNLVYAVQCAAHGGKGLLWNPLQACGEPFFANIQNALLYPPHLVFLFLDPNIAVQAVLIFNMAAGAVGMLLLGRELGFGWPAAIAASLAFELGDPLAQLTSWSPMHNGPWVWLPWTLLCCERLLRLPRWRSVVALTVSVALQLLPGFVLITALTYQLIAFRLAWALFLQPGPRPWRSVLMIVGALGLAPALLAVQLVPAAEYARQSFRFLESGATASSALSWVQLPLIDAHSALTRLARRHLPVPFSVALTVLAGIALLSADIRRRALFFLCIAMLYAILGFGHSTPLYALFVKLPPGAATLRVPYRFFWITGLSLAILSGFAVHALVRPMSRAAPPIIGGTVIVGLYLFVPGGLRPVELVAAAVIFVSIAVGSAFGALRTPAAWVVVGVIAFNLLNVPLRWPGQLLLSADVLFTHADSFATLRGAMTSQDRLLIVPDLRSALGFSLMQKTASVLQVPGFHDYEALLGQRFSRYFEATWQNFLPRKKTRADQVPVIAQHRLLDAAAVRFMVAPIRTDPLAAMPGLKPMTISTALRFYRNEAALARARYVPRVEVVPDATALLQRLTRGTVDLRTVALIEAPLPSGFAGETEARQDGTVTFLVNDPEHLALEVDAPQRGFLVVADTFYPGWHAAVNEVAVPIVRANYMFRLIEVPRGRSRVEFRYRPFSLLLGAALSLVTALALVVLWRRDRSTTAHHFVP